ncbi:hypothetical protein HanIR_Chr15g0740581 [Helianthus annuus]|nr:hypothetical protein HanIR_Chr15g0740581 [Helianthus annuus]
MTSPSSKNTIHFPVKVRADLQASAPACGQTDAHFPCKIRYDFRWSLIAMHTNKGNNPWVVFFRRFSRRH